MDFSLDFFIEQVVPKLLAAVPVTLALTVITAVGCAPIALMLAAAVRAKSRLWRFPARAYVLVMRGTPLLVQIYMIYYGLGSMIPRAWIRSGMFSPVLRDAFTYGAVALILNEAAYVAVILRSGIDSVSKGEKEAAAALGLSRIMVFFLIILPRAVIITLPVLASELILVLKSTVLVSTITVFDVLGTANVIRFETFHVLEPLFGAAIVYIILVGIISIVAIAIERRTAVMR